MIESITDGIGDDRVGDHLRPVIQRQLRVNTVDLPCNRSLMISHRSCASVEESLRMPILSMISTSGRIDIIWPLFETL